MPKNKEGKHFSSKFRMARYDRESSQHEAAESPEFEAGEQEGMEEGSDSPEQVVAEHGKANEVTVNHDHENGKHEVTSKHEDGHEHKSMHASAEEAHDHAKALACDHKGGEEGMGDDYQVPGLEE